MCMCMFYESVFGVENKDLRDRVWCYSHTKGEDIPNQWCHLKFPGWPSKALTSICSSICSYSSFTILPSSFVFSFFFYSWGHDNVFLLLLLLYISTQHIPFKMFRKGRVKGYNKSTGRLHQVSLISLLCFSLDLLKSFFVFQLPIPQREPVVFTMLLS